MIRDCSGRPGGRRVSPSRATELRYAPCQNDVLQYSDADRDIARDSSTPGAVGGDPGNGPPGPAPGEAPEAEAEQAARGGDPARGHAAARDGEDRCPARRGPAEKPARVASRPAEDTQSAGLPLPVIVLAALSGVLLASGAAGWARRTADADLGHRAAARIRG